MSEISEKAVNALISILLPCSFAQLKQNAKDADTLRAMPKVLGDLYDNKQEVAHEENEVRSAFNKLVAGAKRLGEEVVGLAKEFAGEHREGAFMMAERIQTLPSCHVYEDPKAAFYRDYKAVHGEQTVKDAASELEFGKNYLSFLQGAEAMISVVSARLGMASKIVHDKRGIHTDSTSIFPRHLNGGVTL
jgi:hypothetical protein